MRVSVRDRISNSARTCSVDRRLAATIAFGAILVGACHADRAVTPTVGAAAAPNVHAQGATSHKRGTVTIALVMRPHTAADVPFTGERKIKDFVLDDDADPALPNRVTFTTVKPGEYEVEMDAAPPDGPLTDIRCVSTGGTDNNVVEIASRRVTINVEASESVVCTFIDGWEASDMLTHSQSSYGDFSTPGGAFLGANFNSFYPTDLIVGGTNRLVFSNAAGLFTYLPATGPAGVLSSTFIDPITTSAGELGGEVTALHVNVDFSASLGNAVPLEDLMICDFASLPSMNGQTVGQFLATASHLLGGGSAAISPTQAAALSRFINTAFVLGTPSAFAQASLFDGACP